MSMSNFNANGGPVLVVDDDADTLVFVQTLLKEVMGTASVSAGDAMEAFTIINKVRPRLILLDVRMPGPGSSYDGLMVARRVKGNPATRHIPIIAVSAISDGKALARDAGCDDFIAKPFEIDTFTKVVRQHLPGGFAGKPA